MLVIKLSGLGRKTLILMTAVWLSTLAPAGAQAQVTAFKQAVAEQAARDDQLAAFYRSREFLPVWTGESAQDAARRAALIDALDMAQAHGLPAQRYGSDALIAQMRAAVTARDLGTVEVALSRAFLQFAHDVQSGVLEPGQVVRDIKRTAPRRDAATLFNGLITNAPRAYLRGLAPQTAEYARLMRSRMMLEVRLQQGGWGPVVSASKLEPGQTGSALIVLRDRLVRMGYLPATAVASYDKTLEAAVLRFQIDHGLEPDGVAGQGTLAEINIGVEERMKSIIVAMERERWMNVPEGRGARHIDVNLTDFSAKIIDNDKVTFQTRSVVGANSSDRRSPEFSDVMEFMVINPSWYVPRSIIVKEYLPKLRNNPGAVGHLEITDSRGRKVNRGNGFSQYSASSFPFAMRQPPGPRNALGLVKFMFPNKYNIYLHDTPAKNLFSREVRAFSHGCIRLNDPFDFAYALLARQTDDPEGFFQSRLRTGAEQRVELEQPVPVHLMYRTAFTQAKGKTQYRRDVYGRDALIWEALRNAGVALPAQQS